MNCLISRFGDYRWAKTIYCESAGVWSCAPYFNFNDNKVNFDANDIDNANDNYGSVSGFAAKSLFLRIIPPVDYKWAELFLAHRLNV